GIGSWQLSQCGDSSLAEDDGARLAATGPGDVASGAAADRAAGVQPGAASFPLSALPDRDQTLAESAVDQLCAVAWPLRQLPGAYQSALSTGRAAHRRAEYRGSLAIRLRLAGRRDATADLDAD